MSGRKKTSIISVQNIDITIATFNMDDYICITDMAKAKGGESRAADIIKNWIRGRATLEFLGTWEMMFNPDFKVVEFDHFKAQAGLPTFTLSAKQWIEKTCAVGIYVQAGRYGGTYAHRDILLNPHRCGKEICFTAKQFLQTNRVARLRRRSRLAQRRAVRNDGG